MNSPWQVRGRISSRKAAKVAEIAEEGISQELSQSRRAAEIAEEYE